MSIFCISTGKRKTVNDSGITFIGNLHPSLVFSVQTWEYLPHSCADYIPSSPGFLKSSYFVSEKTDVFWSQQVGYQERIEQSHRPWASTLGLIAEECSSVAVTES